MPPPPFTESSSVLVNATLRQTIHVTLGGRQVRIEFSNAFGGRDLPITKATIALPAGGQAGVSAIEPGSAQRWFDAVLDFDRVARDPANPGQILPAYDSGDHLHLTPQGYRALAGSIPLRLFTNAANFVALGVPMTGR